ncbi:SsrA-binding protein [Rickettsiales endosymbiont of Paramecium tredecaurelia]|uniref:SsrA-binding protein SmpB n=1 Tax=Candidatus Sarmatiella mevalonica TaxID=2770581 RepID=UPI00192201F2|nr:SsrA-binding protein SmpB [Candidatus Sarmatiella mevalonica]MBL3284835.1 SsrA-binding protein [Candidatus Sarmatiella mevalonica]
MSNTKGSGRVIARNRRASYEYFIEERFEAGVVLVGSEAKACRACLVKIEDAHAQVQGNEVFLHNVYIAPYESAKCFPHDAKRVRKLLLHKKEIKKILGKVKIKGYTLAVLSMYFNSKRLVKLELALAKGKKLHDKRQTVQDREWEREHARSLKQI